MNRQGPPGQTMRPMAGFTTQNGPQTQGGPLGARRIQQNSKVGNPPGWAAFGMQNGAAPGLGAPPARAPGNNTSFAQTIGGSQSSAPLDLSEFPSLSGGPQPQYQNPGQAVWSNQRTTQQTPVGRPQQSPGNPLSTTQQAPGNHQAQEHAQQNLDDAFFSSNMNGSIDDYRHGGQGGVGQLSGSGQAQAGSGEEFPPLGRLGHGDIGQDRRTTMMQNAAGGAYQTASNFGTVLSNPPRVNTNIATYQDQSKTGQTMQNGMTNTSNLNHSIANNDTGRSPFADGTPPMESQSGDQPKSPTDMSEADRYGLSALLGTIRNSNSDAASLAIGQNLNTLGLDLDSSEPLHPTFGGPFANAPARPLQPEYTLPQCYTVGNTHPVEDKLNGLSDETLLWMFYNMPRDVLQETAAKELTDRNWRYHKVLGLWLTKEANVPEPQLIAPEVERGRYVVFNNRTWQREQREMIIRYSDLDDHLTNPSQRILIPH